MTSIRPENPAFFCGIIRPNPGLLRAAGNDQSRIHESSCSGRSPAGQAQTGCARPPRLLAAVRLKRLCLAAERYFDDVAPLVGRQTIPEAEPVAALFGLAGDFERAGVVVGIGRVGNRIARFPAALIDARSTARRQMIFGY